MRIIFGWFMSFIIVISRSIPRRNFSYMAYCVLIELRELSRGAIGRILTAASCPVRLCLAILTRPEAPFPTHSPRIQGPIDLGSVGRSKALAPPAAAFSLAQRVPRGAAYLMGGA